MGNNVAQSMTAELEDLEKKCSVSLSYNKVPEVFIKGTNDWLEINLVN